MKELITIQSRLKAPKDNFNSFGRYKYRSAEGILEAVKPLLTEQKCTLTITDDIVGVGDRIYVKATVTIKNEKGDSESTTAFAREEESKKGMDASQVTGTASSYARKYALNGLFAIDDTKDADALNTSKEYTQPAQPAQPAVDPVAQAFELIRPEIETAASRDILRMLIEKNPDLAKSAQFKQAVNARWKQVS